MAAEQTALSIKKRFFFIDNVEYIGTGLLVTTAGGIPVCRPEHYDNALSMQCGPLVSPNKFSLATDNSCQFIPPI